MTITNAQILERYSADYPELLIPKEMYTKPKRIVPIRTDWAARVEAVKAELIRFSWGARIGKIKPIVDGEFLSENKIYRTILLMLKEKIISKEFESSNKRLDKKNKRFPIYRLSVDASKNLRNK